MIEMKKFRVLVPTKEDSLLGYTGENLSRRLTIAVDDLGTWAYKLDIRNEAGAANIMNMTTGDGVIYVDIERAALQVSGKVHAQIRAIDGDVVKCSNIFSLFIGDSVQAVQYFESLPPTEFEQLEERIAALKDDAENAAKDAAGQADRAEAAAEELSGTIEDVNQLKSDIVKLDDKVTDGKNKVSLSWKKGTINNDGSVSNASTQLVTELFSFSGLASISQTSGFRYKICTYESDGTTKKALTNWNTNENGKFTFDSTLKYRFNLSKVSGATVDVSDGNNLSVEGNTEMLNRLITVENKTNQKNEFTVQGDLNNFEKGSYSTVDGSKGDYSETNRTIRLKNPIILRLGATISCAYVMTLLEVDEIGNFVGTASSNVNKYTATKDIRLLVTVYPDVSIPDTLLNLFNDSTLFEKNEIEKYNFDTLSAINYSNCENGVNLSDFSKQKMSHGAVMEYDSFVDDGTFWIAYSADDTTTAEGGGTTTEYTTVCKYNAIKKEIQRVFELHVGDAIGLYTQLDYAPYNPLITVFSDYVRIHFIGRKDGKYTFCFYDINKTTNTAENFNYCNISYGGNSYVFNTDNIKNAYQSVTGKTIESQSIMSVNSHFKKYNNEYYTVVDGAFSQSDTGYRAMLIKSNDMINWSVVKAFDSFHTVMIETMLENIDSVFYFVTRTNGVSYLLSYDVSNNTLSDFVPIPFASISSRSSIIKFNDDLYLMANIIDNTPSTNKRNHMGVYRISSNCGVEMICKILRENGIQYPDMTIWKNSICICFTEDMRKLDISSKKTNIKFAVLTV